MLEYPSIPKIDDVFPSLSGRSMIAFVKYDGSNLRFEWTKKSGWCKYGTRTRLFDESDDIFGNAIPLFHATIVNQIDPLLRKHYKSAKKIVVFCEYVGNESFAGVHVKNDPTLRLVLFDVVIDDNFIPAKTFVKQFGELSCAAQVVKKGILDHDFVSSVKDDQLLPLGTEGVICKGGEDKNAFAVKIKTNSYLKKLIETFGYEDYKKYL